MTISLYKKKNLTFHFTLFALEKTCFSVNNETGLIDFTSTDRGTDKGY